MAKVTGYTIQLVCINKHRLIASVYVSLGEDHPSGCRWLIAMAMVTKSPKDRVVGPLPNGLTSWLINRGDPHHSLGTSSK